MIGTLLGVSTWKYVDITKSQQGVVHQDASMIVCNGSTTTYFIDGSEFIGAKSSPCYGLCVKDHRVVSCRDATDAMILMIGAVISLFIFTCCFVVSKIRKV